MASKALLPSLSDEVPIVPLEYRDIYPLTTGRRTAGYDIVEFEIDMSDAPCLLPYSEYHFQPRIAKNTELDLDAEPVSFKNSYSTHFKAGEIKLNDVSIQNYTSDLDKVNAL